jgi:uncharacterized membrane protein YiaA
MSELLANSIALMVFGIGLIVIGFFNIQILLYKKTEKIPKADKSESTSDTMTIKQSIFAVIAVGSFVGGTAYFVVGAFFALGLPILKHLFY